MPGCGVPGCKNRSEKGFRLFRLPSGARNVKRRAFWIHCIGRSELNPNSMICEVHFSENQFEQKRLDKRRPLRPEAVPDLLSNPAEVERYRASVEAFYKTSNLPASANTHQSNAKSVLQAITINNDANYTEGLLNSLQNPTDSNDELAKKILSLNKRKLERLRGRLKSDENYKLWVRLIIEMKKRKLSTLTQVKEKCGSFFELYKYALRNNMKAEKLLKLQQTHKEPSDIVLNSKKTAELPIPLTVENDSSSRNTQLKRKNLKLFEIDYNKQTMTKLLQLLEQQHKERMEATEKWRKEQLEFRKQREENRQRDRRLLISCFLERYKSK